MKAQLSPLEHCPIANVCALTSEDAPPCGEDPSHLPPFITAETMCVNALAGRAQLETAKISEGLRPTKFAENHTAIAWYELEQGMAPDGSATAEHFDNALEHVDEAMHNPNSWFRDTLSAAILHLYRPAFMARKDGVLPGAQERTSFHQGLGILYDALLATPVHVSQSQHILDTITEGQPHRPCLGGKGERNGLVAKLVGMMLAARQNIFLYPASERERQASGDFMAHNHDAYILEDGQKVPLKIRLKSRSDATAGGLRTTSYDAQIVYINMAGLINGALQVLRQNQRREYASLLKTHLGRQPDVIDVGRILRNELGGQPQSKASVVLVETIATKFEHMLFEGQDTPGQPGISTQPSSSAVSKPAQWEILPTEILSRHKNPREHDSPKSLQIAARAHELYLRYGNSVPEPEDLKQLIGNMRQVGDPYILVRCAGAYIDLARNPQTTPDDAIRLIEASTALTSDFAAKKWQEVPPQVAHLLYRCRLERAFTEKYKRTLSGKAPNLDDEARLYLNLLQLGRDSLEPALVLDAPAQTDVRGVQFEIAAHLLNTRLNLRNNKIIQSMWPSLPREDSPHDFNFDYRNGWDAAVTTGDFLDQGLSCRYVQLKSVDNGAIYHPSIIIVRGREDLATSTTADIIIAALQELYATSSALATHAKTALNTYEQLFLQRLSIND